MVSVGYLCTQKISLDGAETLANLLRYLMFKSGPLTSNVAEAGLFLRTRVGAQTPDLQLLFGPAYYRAHGLVRRKEHCFGFGPTLITPESRGTVALRSTNPLDAPAIRANYLSTDADLQDDDRRSASGAAAGACEGVRSVSRRRVAPGTNAKSTTILSNSCATNSKLSTTRSGLAKWGTIRLRLWTHG